MTSDDRTRALGARLRSIRNQQGLSLAQVEARSGGVWKAVVVGAYERGDRAVSLHVRSDNVPALTAYGRAGFLDREAWRLAVRS